MENLNDKNLKNNEEQNSPVSNSPVAGEKLGANAKGHSQDQSFKENIVSEDQDRPQGLVKKISGMVTNVMFFLLMGVMVFLVFTIVQSQFSGGPPSMFGYQMYIVKGGSMSPTFEAGSLAFLQPIETGDIQEGSIITYKSPEKEQSLTTHRVVQVNREDGGINFTTRGDANLVNDQSPVYPENVIGEVTSTIPYAGYLMNFGQTKTGILTLVIIPGMFIIGFELRNLYIYATQWEEEKKKEKESQLEQEKQLSPPQGSSTQSNFQEIDEGLIVYDNPSQQTEEKILSCREREEPK